MKSPKMVILEYIEWERKFEAKKKKELEEAKQVRLKSKGE